MTEFDRSGIQMHPFSSREAQCRPCALAALLAAVLLLFGACSRDPNVIKRRYLASGDRYFDKSDYRAAAIQYQNAIRVDAKFDEAHARLGRTYLKLGIWSGAYQELTRAVSDNPNDLEAQVDLGNLLLAGHEFHHAQDIANTVLAKDPKNVQGRILLANSLAALNDMEGSLEEMQGAIQLAPGQPHAYLNLAVLQADAKQTQEAEASFKKAIELDPKSSRPLVALGNFYLQQRRWSDAEQQFRSAIALEPKNALAWEALARFFVAQGQRQNGEQVLQDAKKSLGDEPEGYRLLGDFEFAVGDIDKAVSEYASIYKNHPKDLLSEQNYIQLLIFHHDYDLAAKLNDKILDDNAKDVRAQLARGEIFYAQNRADDAINALQNVIKAEPDNPGAHYLLGLAFAEKGDTARGEAEWQQALKLRPNLVDAHRALITLAEQHRDWTVMVRRATALIAVAPASPEGYVDRATAEADSGLVHDAEADLQRAEELAPKSPLPVARMAALRLLEKRLPEAEKLYQQALALNPSHLEAYNGLVQVYVEEKHPEKAMALTNARIAAEPSNSAYYATQAKLFVAAHQDEQAEAAAQKAVNANPNDLNALSLLAQIQQFRGELDKAVATYQKEVAARPDDPLVYTLVAQLKEQQGDWKQAQGFYQKALQVRPDYPPAANNLAYLMLQHGLDLDVALSLAESARRGMPDSPQAGDTLGWAYYHKGIYGSARTQLEDAVRLEPGKADYHYHLGLTYVKLGDKAKGRAELERALQIDPGLAKSTDVRDVLAQIAHK